jgi:endonuclease VIII
VPEGDTVWRTAQRLDRALHGAVLTNTDFRVPEYAELDLAGERLVEVVSRGKHILIRLPDVTIHSHLKMEGAWHLYRLGSPWRAPGFSARVVLDTDAWQAVGFQLGTLDVVPRGDEEQLVGHLGPDLLGSDWDAEVALARLTSRPEVPIGEALLDQRNLAGIGNLYKCEVLFLLGVHPDTPVGEVDVVQQVIDKAQRLLAANKDRPEQTTTANSRRGQRHWVYGRGGQPCRRCGTPIRSEALATLTDRARAVGAVSGVDNPSRARVSYWCPSCQPGSP